MFIDTTVLKMGLIVFKISYYEDLSNYFLVPFTEILKEQALQVFHEYHDLFARYLILTPWSSENQTERCIFN